MVCILYFVSCIFINPVKAYDAAFTYQIADKTAISGDIIANYSGQGFILDAIAYDSHIFGVLQDEPLAVYRDTTPDPSKRPIITGGNTIVNVNDYNGAIVPGDYITSSPIKGKGMKAGQSGQIVGIALEDAHFGQDAVTVDSRQVHSAQILVAVRVEYAELTTARSNVRLFDAVNAAFFRSVQNPEKFTLAIRYIIAGLIAIVAFIIGFFAFTRSIAKGIEAMGRNPLARRSIQIGIIIQVVLTVLTSLGAIVLAYIIIRI